MTEPNNYKVYSLLEPNSEFVRYIGITGDTLECRLSGHMRVSGVINHKKNWILSLKKEGLKPDIALIEDGLTIEQAKKKEREYIMLFKSAGARLTNLTLGGEGTVGYKHTKETRKKLSESLKGIPAWNKGMKWTDETLKKISDRVKEAGYKMPKEQRDKQREQKLCKKLPDAIRNKIVAYYNNNSHPNKGRKLTGKNLENFKKGRLKLSQKHVVKFSIMAISYSLKGRYEHEVIGPAIRMLGNSYSKKIIAKWQ